MDLTKPFLGWKLLLLVTALILSSRSLDAQSSAQRPLVTQPVDNSKLVTLGGNVYPLARAEFDHGPAPANLRMDRMLLVLQRSPEQESALQKLLLDQQDRSSPLYRHWLSPEQFGQQFGPADSDIQQVVSWLQSAGFQSIRVSKGHVMIEFSGTASQVENAFGTSIRKYVVNGEEHWANAGDPEIPSALSAVTRGVFTLHNFYKKPQVHLVPKLFTATVSPGARPQFTSTAGLHALVPADFYTIYNFNPLQIYTSAKIAVVGRSNINLQDVSYFHYWTYDQASSPNVILNGPDPGDLGGSEETEAVLDTTWAGAVAPTAWLSLVVSQSTATTDGADLSELYIIDNNLADVMSESFGDCEADYTSAEAAGIASLAEQAAAQGITYVVAAGDSGPAGCDNPNTETQASHPNSVNIVASTPYTVAVGGTMFSEGSGNSSYWSSSNSVPTLQSALSYIPEHAWNESCTSTQLSCAKPGIWAGGGGASVYIAKPSWQSGVPGIPADGARDVPDVSLTAASHDPYLLCIRGSCIPNAQGQISFAAVGGTSASAPAFAGIMALVGQKTLTRLGQPNFVLYRLAAAENLSQCNASGTSVLPLPTCVFNDVTIGNNSVPGEAGYGTPTAKYQTGAGYDLATGLGSVNVTALINQWDTVAFNPTSTTFSISPTTATHGDPLNVSVSVTPNDSASGTPGGPVWLVQNGYPNGNFLGDSLADLFTLNAQGSFTGVTHLLPGGTYQVYAHYAGDGVFAGSDSTPPVQVLIRPEATSLTFSVLTTDDSGNFIPFQSGPYGTPIYFQAHLSWQSGYGTPGAYVNFYDNNGYGAGYVYLDKNGNGLTTPLTQIAAGAHSITAAYYGDNSFASSSNLTPINFTIAQVATSTSLTSQQTSQSLVLTATVTASGKGAPPSGTVTFSNGGTVLATVNLTNGTSSGGTTQATATFDATQLAQGNYSVTASYAGDANYTPSASGPLSLSLAADFAVSDRGITSQTVTAGQTASYINDIAITPFFGFASDVALSCTVPAQAATCSVNPASVTTSSGANIASVSVSTTARSAGLFEKSPENQPFGRESWPLPVSAILCIALLLGFARTRRLRLARTSAFALLLLIGGFGAAGCGGGSSGTSNGGGGGSSSRPQTGTLAGTYTITVTATSNSVAHTMTLGLVVQ